MKKIAFIGSRSFDNRERAAQIIDLQLQIHSQFIFFSGGAQGADTLFHEAAVAAGLECRIMPADWKQYGRKAGLIRNRQLIQMCDHVVAMWDGRSSGTAHGVSLANKLGKDVDMHTYDPRKDGVATFKKHADGWALSVPYSCHDTLGLIRARKSNGEYVMVDVDRTIYRDDIRTLFQIKQVMEETQK